LAWKIAEGSDLRREDKVIQFTDRGAHAINAGVTKPGMRVNDKSDDRSSCSRISSRMLNAII